MSSHLPPLFSLPFRNKPEAVEVTFAGKLHSSFDFSEKRAGLNGLPTVTPSVPKFTQHRCGERRDTLGQPVGAPCTIPRAGALLAATLFSLCACCLWAFPHSGEFSGGIALFGACVLHNSFTSPVLQSCP